jgi:uncharacterized membrane protein (UPF0127 family)
MIRILQEHKGFVVGAFALIVIGGLILLIFLSVTRMDARGVALRIGQAPLLMVEIANTETARMQGLSNRPLLSENRGMFFLFNEAGYHTFWMKDMRFSLDIIWMREGMVVGITENALPEGANPVKIYASPTAVDSVLEVAGGFASRYGVVAGDTVTVTDL